MVILTKRGRIRDDGTTKKLVKAWSGLSIKTVTKETNRKIRLARKAEARSAVAQVVAESQNTGEDIEGEDGLEGVIDEDDPKSGGEEEEEEEDVSSIENDDENGSVLMDDCNLQWKDNRCALAKQLVDPALADEKLTWDSNLVAAGDGGNNLEDHDGYYAVLGCSKTSCDLDINQGYKRIHKNVHQMAL